MKCSWPLLVILLQLGISQAIRCSRENAKIVRTIVRFKIWQVYQTHQAVMPMSCPFKLERDIYYLQEKNKFMEGANKWKCNFCGKSFLTEMFVDRHFDRKHKDSIQQGDSRVCLSDYCDIYRCDVVSGTRKPDFWDIALCIEDDIVETREKCQNLMRQCIPDNLTKNTTKQLTNALHETICSYLTCSKYWEMPPEQTDGVVALYIILSILIVFSILVYYCIFYQYFYTDTFSDNISYDPILSRQPYAMSPPKAELRQRSRQGQP